MRRKYHFNEHADAMIRREYLAPNRDCHAMTRLAKQLNVPRSALSYRCKELGIIESRDSRPWSDRENEILAERAHLSLQVIQRHLKKAGFRRTQSAIIGQRKLMRINMEDAKLEAGVYTGKQLALCMGVDCRTVYRLINKGMLTAKRAGYERDRDYWHITEKSIRAMLINYTAEIDFRKVDKYWLVDILTNRTGAKGAGAKAA